MSLRDLHTGHPILRKVEKGFGASKWTWVRVGVWRDPDRDDEVWTRSSRMLRDIGEQLASDWWSNFYKKTRCERPWMYRNVAERHLCQIIAPYTEFIRCTILQDQDHTLTGAYAERIFDLLKIEGALRNPPPSAVKDLTDEHGRPCWEPRLHRNLFMINEAELASWVAVRRILLEENARLRDLDG